MHKPIAQRIKAIETSICAKEANIRGETASIQALREVADTPEKKEFVVLKMGQLEKRYEDLIEEKRKHVALLKDELRGSFEKMQGLLSYGISTGGLTPDLQLLYDILGDVLSAKDDGDREAAERSVFLCLEHGRFGQEAVQTDDDERILAKFESMPDGEERTCFYNRNRDQIHAGLARRQERPGNE
jgi:hypothetical protein